MSEVLGAFGLLDFTMLRPVLAWRMFWILRTVYFFNFPIFFGPRWTADTESVDKRAHLYKNLFRCQSTHNEVTHINGKRWFTTRLHLSVHIVVGYSVCTYVEVDQRRTKPRSLRWAVLYTTLRRDTLLPSRYSDILFYTIISQHIKEQLLKRKSSNYPFQGR
jgi:hypothetical protein